MKLYGGDRRRTPTAQGAAVSCQPRRKKKKKRKKNQRVILKSCPEAGRRCYLTDDDDPDPGVDSELGDDPVGYAPAHDESHRAPDDGGDAEIEAAAGVGVVGLIVQLSIVGPSESGWKHNGGVKCEPASRQWWALDVTCLSDARRQAQEQHDGTEEAPETVTHGQPEGRNGINLAG